ncbi:MAG: prolyl oligopeptidase family serine peptidase, partial [Oscillospiraceae bacterium]
AVTPIGTLVLGHPMGKAAKGFWLRYGHADLFLKNNFNVFLFDANGFGESEAASFDYPADFLAAGLYAKNKAPKLEVGLVGASFGAGWGLCSMAREGSPYKAAILEAVFPTLPDFWKHYPIAHTAIQTSKIVWPWIERDLRPIEDASRLLNKPNVMLIYGDQDIYTPPAHGEKLSVAMRNSANVEMHVISGGKHTYIYRDQPDEY